MSWIRLRTDCLLSVVKKNETSVCDDRERKREKGFNGCDEEINREIKATQRRKENDLERKQDW